MGILVDLAQEVHAGLEPADTGSLDGDLQLMGKQLADQLAGDGSALVVALLAWNDPEVRAALDRFWRARLDAVEAVVRRHGEVVDASTAARLVAGPIYYQALIERQAPTRETVRAAVTAALVVIKRTRSANIY